MTYPNIHPIDPGNDGWAPPYVFSNPVARLLHLCGMVPVRVRKREQIEWSVAPEKLIPGWAVSQETRPLKVTFTGVRNILRKVGMLYGVKVVADILRTHGNCETLATLKHRDFGNIYRACMATLNADLPAIGPPKKPYA
jgi:hypothetical protein